MVKHLERSRDLFLANQTEGFHLHGNYTAHHEQIRHYMEPLGFTKDSFAVPRLHKHQN